MTVTYREASYEDTEQLKVLGETSYGLFKYDLSEENWGKMSKFLSDLNSYTDLLNISKCFVGEVDEKIVGMAFLVPQGHPTDIFDKEWCYIRMVGVDPNWSGNGIGKRLTTMCIDHAKQSNERVIALHTSEFMNSARYIYEKMGFRAVKELAPHYGKRYWLYLLDI